MSNKNKDADTLARWEPGVTMNEARLHDLMRALANHGVIRAQVEIALPIEVWLKLMDFADPLTYSPSDLSKPRDIKPDQVLGEMAAAAIRKLFYPNEPIR